MVTAFQETTYNGRELDRSYIWLNKSYEFTVRSGEEGILYAVIGIWGTFEVSRLYYFDEVHITLTKKPEGSEFYSFENDMEGWTPNATDLEFGTGLIDWSISRSRSLSEDGFTSLKFDLNNLNGKGKVWIEKVFIVEPRQTYRVTIDYALASADGGAIRTNRIITGALRAHSQTGDDLGAAFQDETRNEGHWGWLHKKYEITVRSKKRRLYVVVGIWGTQEERKTYYFDSICVLLTKE